ncbi:nitrate- and nitrite sensing domain-containing protein [Streptomyces sp. L7]
MAVGLVMGGFQVKNSIDTWQNAQDAENTARLVQAALTCSNAILVERDVSAEPLLEGKGKNDKTVVTARAATDQAADAFDKAALKMPDRANLKRRLGQLQEGGAATHADPRAIAYTSNVKGVQTEEAYTSVEQPLLSFTNELGLGTGNITSYGRSLYAIALAEGAVSLERSIGVHLLIKPGTSTTSLEQQRTALTSYAYLEGIGIQEYQYGGTAEDVATLQAAEAKLKSDAHGDGQAGCGGPEQGLRAAAVRQAMSGRIASARLGGWPACASPVLSPWMPTLQAGRPRGARWCPACIAPHPLAGRQRGQQLVMLPTPPRPRPG